jgi:hypothetical protein
MKGESHIESSTIISKTRDGDQKEKLLAMRRFSDQVLARMAWRGYGGARMCLAPMTWARKKCVCSPKSKVEKNAQAIIDTANLKLLISVRRSLSTPLSYKRCLPATPKYSPSITRSFHTFKMPNIEHPTIKGTDSPAL